MARLNIYWMALLALTLSSYAEVLPVAEARNDCAMLRPWHDSQLPRQPSGVA